MISIICISWISDTHTVCGPKKLIESIFITSKTDYNIVNKLNYVHINISLLNFMFKDDICKECI